LKIILGTAQFGLKYGISNTAGCISSYEAQKIIKFAPGLGVNTLDTAATYGDSELTLGALGIDNFKTITKLPKYNLMHDNSEIWVIKSITNSLARLGISKLYGVLMHHPEDLLSSYGESLYKGLKSAKDIGLVSKIGISTYCPNLSKNIIEKFDIDLIQCPINLLDNRFDLSGVLDLCKKSKIEIHARSIFLQGLLLMSMDNLPRKFLKWSAIFSRYHQYLSDTKITPLEACLISITKQKNIDGFLIGVQSSSELAQIVSVIDKISYEINLPDFSSNDELLINPSLWASI
jgi:aryl-alcohol dehydrogenase-like predicted oxidoreductase